MTNKNLTIIVVLILGALIVLGILVRNGRKGQPDESANTQANTELKAPDEEPENTVKNSQPVTPERGKPIDNINMKTLEKPQMTIDKNKNYKAVVTTSKGVIKIDLLEKTAPIAVNNFVYLANNQFYSDIKFHRIIKGFMIQTGDPLGDGTGGPGYKFDDEPFEGEYTKGTVAMANAGPNTNGSQFFIMHADAPLPKNYVIFGKVEQGLDVVDEIANSEVKDNGMGEASTPIDPPIIKTVEIVTE